MPKYGEENVKCSDAQRLLILREMFPLDGASTFLILRLSCPALPRGPAEISYDFWFRISTWEICCAWENLLFHMLSLYAVQTRPQHGYPNLRTEKCHQVPSSAVAATAQRSGLIPHFLSEIVLFPCSVKPVKEVSYSIFNLAA